MWNTSEIKGQNVEHKRLGIVESGIMKHTRARILYVDGHQDTRLMLMFLLEMDGFGVMTASNVKDALALARATQFDIYIIEQLLPDGSGTQLCAQLRDFDARTPVLYYTSQAGENYRQSALSECGDAYLEKPVCINDFKETVLRLLFESENKKIGTAAGFRNDE